MSLTVIHGSYRTFENMQIHTYLCNEKSDEKGKGCGAGLNFYTKELIRKSKVY